MVSYLCKTSTGRLHPSLGAVRVLTCPPFVVHFTIQYCPLLHYCRTKEYRTVISLNQETYTHYYIAVMIKMGVGGLVIINITHVSSVYYRGRSWLWCHFLILALTSLPVIWLPVGGHHDGPGRGLHQDARGQTGNHPAAHGQLHCRQREWCDVFVAGVPVYDHVKQSSVYNIVNLHSTRLFVVIQSVYKHL